MNRYFTLILTAVQLLSISAQAEVPDLPKLKIDPKKIAVTGLSSGGFMAAQLGVAYSKTFSGVAVFAGGAYGCAQGSLAGAGLCLGFPNRVDVQMLLELTKSSSRAGWIDPVSHLKEQKIYLFSGKRDSTTPPATVAKLREFYEGLADSKNLLVEDSLPAGHGQPTLSYGVDCGKTASPWILNCGYDGAGVALQHLLGPLKPAVPAVASHLTAFNQNSYSDSTALMGDQGYLYVPEKCKGATHRCGLLVALHGCRQSPDLMGPEYREHAGFNEWAESNEMVVLYPSARKSFFNPKACWDWWGYTSSAYADRRGPQIRAVKKMIDTLAGE